MSRPINRWRCPLSHAAILVTPNGQAILASLWDDFRAARAKPVSLAPFPAIMGHSRPVAASPVVLQ